MNYSNSNVLAIMADFTLPLDIKSLEIVSQYTDSKGNIVLAVESKCDRTTCHKCGKDATKRYGYGAIMEVRHTSVFDMPVILRIKALSIFLLVWKSGCIKGYNELFKFKCSRYYG